MNHSLKLKIFSFVMLSGYLCASVLFLNLTLQGYAEKKEKRQIEHEQCVNELKHLEHTLNY